MASQKIRIVVDGVRAELFIGNERLAKVRSYKLEHLAPGAPAVLTLEIYALNVEIEGNALVETATSE